MKWVRTEENELEVLETVIENPRTSLRSIQANSDLRKSTIHYILKDSKFHPYKPTFINEILERDYDLRLYFSFWVQGEIESDGEFHRKILFSDEATFTTNGVVSSQNCRWWSDNNPNFTIECKSQYSAKTNVWCGILDNKIVGPFFFRENLNSQRYLQFLQNELSDELDRLPLNLRLSMWFQQDGAPIHSTQVITNYLEQEFDGKWIGRYSNYQWPPRSPDLSPLDFFLWGYLKETVYARRPFRNLDHLENEIRAAVLQISPETLRKVVDHFSKQTIKCIVRNGRHTEH